MNPWRRVWLVTVGDQERNFPRRRDAVAWLRRLTHDDRPTPTVVRETPLRYRYYGPGDDLRSVTCAVIDKLEFPPRRFYAPKKRVRQQRRAVPPSDDAVREDVAAPVVPIRDEVISP